MSRIKSGYTRLPTNDRLWVKLRSSIYIRDKGLCWICGKFVVLKEYDLGHIIDKCHGGEDADENLAVMHHICNMAKPRHHKLEDALEWKTDKTENSKHRIATIDKPITEQKLTHVPQVPTRLFSRWSTLNSSSNFTPEDKTAIKQLVLEYFNNHPDLLSNGSGYNKDRIEASRQIAKELNITITDVRAILLESGLVTPRPPQITDGSQYRYVHEHLNELLQKYEIVKHENLYSQPKLLGLSVFCFDIMLFLSGQLNKVSKCNYGIIQRRLAQLNIPTNNAISYLENKPKVLAI